MTKFVIKYLINELKFSIDVSKRFQQQLQNVCDYQKFSFLNIKSLKLPLFGLTYKLVTFKYKAK